MKPAPALMVQGTASDVGKSLLVTAICRILREEGWRVAPFKAQNMALNSYVTPDGGEIGRAQALQAWAAGVDPEVDMNPILLKPTGENRSQVIVRGQPRGDYSALSYREEFHREGLAIVTESLWELRQRYQVVVIEGAGSPAEVNLKDRDLVNMRVAELAEAPVLLATDIDRGGALAALVGTLELLTPSERERVQGLVINKFRGDRALLQPALTWLAERTGRPVVGVLPYLPDLGLEGEDSLNLPTPGQGDITVVVPWVPHLSNFTDFDPLRFEPGIRLVFARHPEEVEEPDAVILGGSKSTAADLLHLRRLGWDQWLTAYAATGRPVGGICGGYQMLGQELADPEGIESSDPLLPGLGLLPIHTTFCFGKNLRQERARLVAASGYWAAGVNTEVTGYEIHAGETEVAGPELFRLEGPDGERSEGGRRGEVFGTYLHGLFENDSLRWAFLNQLRHRRGLPDRQGRPWGETRQAGLERLVRAVREGLDWPLVRSWLGL